MGETPAWACRVRLKGSAGLTDRGKLGATRWAQEAEKRALDSTHQTRHMPLNSRRYIQIQPWAGNPQPSSPWGCVQI